MAELVLKKEVDINAPARRTRTTPYRQTLDHGSSWHGNGRQYARTFGRISELITTWKLTS